MNSFWSPYNTVGTVQNLENLNAAPYSAIFEIYVTGKATKYSFKNLKNVLGNYYLTGTMLSAGDTKMSKRL